MSFLTEVFAGIVAGGLLVLVTALLSRTARWVLTGVLGRLVNVDVEFVFSTQSEASADITKDIRQANFAYLMTGRGSELQRDTFADLFKVPSSQSEKPFRILLPDPDSSIGTDWIAVREREISTFDATYSPGMLQKQIRTNIEFLRKPVSEGCADLRLFSGPHLGRIVLTNRAAFFTPYRKTAHGRATPCIKYRPGDLMYECLLRFFNQMWDSGRTIQ